jgi:O-antigen/teichoic acid export membrane protein
MAEMPTLPTSASQFALKEGTTAARNTIFLLLSFGASWAIGFAGRLIVPRQLGPEVFGAYQFADYFSATFFVISVLGYDTYIRREVSVRPTHANEFFGGLLLFRAGASLVALALMLLVFATSGKPAYIRNLLLIFSINQVLGILNNSYATLLNAVSSVRGLSVLNVIAKVSWAILVFVFAYTGGGAASFAWALVASEGLKTIVLTSIVARELSLNFRIDIPAARTALVASMPFLVVSITGTLYANADVSLMSFRTSDIEVGWYGAAVSLLAMTLFFTVIIHNVFLPMISRAPAGSEELFTISRRALELVVTLVTPMALFGALESALIIQRLFGASFAPAAGSLRVLAPVILLLYVAILPALVLTRLDRGWTVTWLSSALLVINLVLNWFAIPYGEHRWGAGGAGIAAADVWLVCEGLNVAVFLYLTAECFLDRRNLLVFAKTAGTCAVVAVLHSFLAPSLMAIAAEATVYLALVLGTGALRVGELIQFAREVLRARQTSVAPAE